LSYWIIKHKQYELLLETNTELVIEFDKDASFSLKDLVDNDFLTKVIG